MRHDGNRSHLSLGWQTIFRVTRRQITAAPVACFFQRHRQEPATPVMAPASRIVAEVFQGKAYQLRASAHNAIARFRRSALEARGRLRMRVRDGGSVNGLRGAVHNGVLRSGLRRCVLRSMGRRGVFSSQLMNRRSSVLPQSAKSRPAGSDIQVTPMHSFLTLGTSYS